MHLLVMAIFAAAVATVMAVIDSERHDARAKALYEQMARELPDFDARQVAAAAAERGE